MNNKCRIQQLVFFSIATICFLPLYAQLSENDKYDYSDGDYYYSIEDYNQSAKFFLKLVTKYPDNAKFNYRLGLCYLKIPGEDDKALPYLQKAVQEIDPKYVSMNSKNSGAPPEAWLYLGDAQHRANKLIDASQAYHNYKSYITTSETELQTIYKRLIGLGISYEASIRPSGYFLSNLGETINSKFSEYNPVVSDDQSTLAYTSYREPKDKIMITYLVNGSWTEPADITAQVGSKGDFYTVALSANGEELYLSNYDPGNSDIFVSKKAKGKWTKMEPLDSKINSKSMESYATLSADGSEIYFSSDRAGGSGGFDLYYAKREGETWTKPVNLGTTINSSGNEEAPFLSPDGKTLYFSSDGHQTIGGMDYLSTTKDENGQWTAPVNLGVPINTPGDDISICFFSDTKSGYLARINENGESKRDLFLIAYSPPPPPEPEPEALIVAATLPLSEPEIVETKQEEVVQAAEPLPEVTPKTEPVMEPQVTEKTPVVITNTENYSRTGEIFTIQIMALLKPRDAAVFSKLNKEKLKVSYGNDGFARYTYGQFESENQANAELKKVVHLGFKDAFIRKTSEISNY